MMLPFEPHASFSELNVWTVKWGGEVTEVNLSSYARW